MTSLHKKCIQIIRWQSSASFCLQSSVSKLPNIEIYGENKHQSRNSIIAVLPITVETLLEDINRVIDRPETRNGLHHFILRRQSIRVDSYQEYSRERRELSGPLLEDLKNNVTSYQEYSRRHADDKEFRNPNTFRTLYCSLVRPGLEYCSTLCWSSE
uniref:Uncharacterized protein n=1 Tax=Cacopsylla melanoneura TaxID=428564 RepID=A0A8D8M9C3_9HEMI